SLPREISPPRLARSSVRPDANHRPARHSSSPHADTRSIHARLTLQKVQCVADIQDLMLRNEPLATDSYPSSHLRESQPIICLHCIDSLQKAAAFAPSSVVNSHRYQSGRGKSGGNRLDGRLALSPSWRHNNRRRFAVCAKPSRREELSVALNPFAKEQEISGRDPGRKNCACHQATLPTARSRLRFNGRNEQSGSHYKNQKT